MLYPTINELTKGEFNRYELSIATAKCARMVTDEYVKQREEAEQFLTGAKETDRPLNSMIQTDLRDEKSVKIAIRKIYNEEFTIKTAAAAQLEEQEELLRAQEGDLLAQDFEATEETVGVEDAEEAVEIEEEDQTAELEILDGVE